MWNWLHTVSKLRIVAVRKDSKLPGGLVFGTSEILYLLTTLEVCEVDQLSHESVSWYLLGPSSDSCSCSVSDSDWKAVLSPRGLGRVHAACVTSRTDSHSRWSWSTSWLAKGSSRVTQQGRGGDVRAPLVAMVRRAVA